MDNDESPSSKRSHKDTPKNPPPVSQPPPPPSQFHQQESLMLPPDLSLTLGQSNPQGSSSFTDFNPLLQRHSGQISTSSAQSSSSSSTLETLDLVHVSRGLMIPHQSSAFSRYQPQTSADTSSSLSRGSLIPHESSAFRRYHPQTSAATSSSLSRGSMIPHESSAFRRYHPQTSAASSSSLSRGLMIPQESSAFRRYHPQTSAATSSSAPNATSSRGLMIPPAAQPAATMRPGTSNELGFMGSVTTLDQSSPQLPEKLVQFIRNHVRNMVQGFRQNQPTITREEVVQNLEQSSRQLPQNQPTMDHQFHENRGIKRSRSNFGDGLSLGGIYQSSMSQGSSSMVRPSDPQQGSSSSSDSD